jgi:hypothetical protein
MIAKQRTLVCGGHVTGAYHHLPKINRNSIGCKKKFTAAKEGSYGERQPHQDSKFLFPFPLPLMFLKKTHPNTKKIGLL